MKDIRLSELRILQGFADNKWQGAHAGKGSDQHNIAGLEPQLYADMIVTLIDDGYLITEDHRFHPGSSSYLLKKHGLHSTREANAVLSEAILVRVGYRGCYVACPMAA